MPRKKLRLAACVLVCFSACLLSAQDKAARDRLLTAHAQYYTPTTGGLKSFHCDASIDWKAMLSRFSGSDVPDDTPVLKYLQSVHLSVDDDLNGKGSLGWASPGDPPAGKEDSTKQIEEGLQTTLAGFFTSWNAYMNGSMVPLPDKTVTTTSVGDGVHLSGTAGDLKLDEDFDKNMLLTQALVVSPALRVLAKPTYVSSPDGLIVSTITSQINQPPTAPQTESTIRVDYAKVNAFQLPSHVVFDIKNTGVIEIGFSACQVSLASFAKKP